MIAVNIKPFSINDAWRGRRYKTLEYKKWRIECCLLMQLKKNHQYPIKGYVEIHYEFFLKNYEKTDVDNLMKTTSDALVERGVISDDRFVKKYVVEKFKVDMLDEEHIRISIKKLDGSHYKDE